MIPLSLCLFHLEILIFVFMLQARVKGSTWIPIFDVDNRLDIGALSKKATTFMMGIS